VPEAKLGIGIIVMAKKAARRIPRVQKVSASIDDDETNRKFSSWGELGK
jgi:hypothetical protein